MDPKGARGAVAEVTRILRSAGTYRLVCMYFYNAMSYSPTVFIGLRQSGRTEVRILLGLRSRGGEQCICQLMNVNVISVVQTSKL